LITTLPVANNRVATHTHLHVIANPKAVPLTASPIFKSPILHLSRAEGAVAYCGKNRQGVVFLISDE
jgi:hypothetical protein